MFFSNFAFSSSIVLLLRIRLDIVEKVEVCFNASTDINVSPVESPTINLQPFPEQISFNGTNFIFTKLPANDCQIVLKPPVLVGELLDCILKFEFYPEFGCVLSKNVYKDYVKSPQQFTTQLSAYFLSICKQLHNLSIKYQYPCINSLRANGTQLVSCIN